MTMELDYSKDEEVDTRKLLLKLLLLTKTYSPLFAGCILVSILGSIGFYFSKTPVYESKMVISSDLLDFASVSSIVKILDELIKERNYEEVAKKISLDIEQAAKVNNIKVVDIYEVKENTKKGLFQISVMTENNQLLPALQKGIVRFLEENDYVKKRTSIYKNNLKARIYFLQEEIDQIDSLKKKIETKGVIRDEYNNLLLFDPVTIYQELVLLFERKLELEKEMKIADSFEVVEGFTPFQKPVHPQLVVYLLTGFIVGSFITVIIVSLWELKSFVRKNEL